MRKLYFFFFFLAVLAFSCSKDSMQENFYGSDQQLSSEHFKSPGQIIKLVPSGTDDTQALIDAFALAKAAGPGSVVKLAAGEYHIGFIMVEDFNGSFIGAGIGKTIIIPLMNLPYGDLYAMNLGPELVKFLRGNVRISAMSFRNLEGEPCTGDVLWSFLGLHDWAATELTDLPGNHKITAVVDHVEFVSNPGSTTGWTPYTVAAGVGCGPDFYWAFNLPYSRTDVTVTNCIFRELNWAYQNLSIEEGRTVLSNNSLNTSQGILLGGNIGGSTLISGNEFYTPAGGNSISVLDAYLNYLFESKLSNGCQYEISGNIFHATDAWGAIAIADDRKANGIIDNKNPVLALIKNNWFDLQGSTWAGIWNWITEDAIIGNNKFSGQAKTGVYVDPRTVKSLMLGNNFSKLGCTGLTEIPGYLTFPDAGDYDILLFGSNNTVVSSGKDDTSVLNMGENNKIINVRFNNECKKPIGQSKDDNHRSWEENWGKMRKR